MSIAAATVHLQNNDGANRKKNKGCGVALNRQGIALVASLMLIVFAGIAILGVTVFILQRLSENQKNLDSLQCLYLALTGIQQAVYDFRFRDLTGNGYFTFAQSNVDASRSFVIGGLAGAADDADWLMVNTTSAYLGPSSGGNRDRYLYGLSMQNAVNSKAVTIDRMVVSWNNSRRLRRIDIAGQRVWNGTASTPANCNITNFTLNTSPSVYNIDYLQFDGAMTGAAISIQFIMTDGSSKTLAVFPASADYSFTVKSMGQVTSSNIYRTIKADYNAQTGKITGYNELDQALTVAP